MFVQFGAIYYYLSMPSNLLRFLKMKTAFSFKPNFDLALPKFFSFIESYLCTFARVDSAL